MGDLFQELKRRKVFHVAVAAVFAVVAWLIILFVGEALPYIYPPDDLIWEAPESSMKSLQLEEFGVTSANASLGDLDDDGDGGFSTRFEVNPSADRTYTAALSDLDGDGDLDLVVGNDRPDEKQIYKNDGFGKFTLTGTFGNPDWPTRNVTVVDLTGDNRPEIVVANRGGPKNRSANYVCINDGNGNFLECNRLSVESATTIAAGDFDNDGFTDLVVPHRDRGQSYIFINDGKGGFTDRRPIGPSNSSSRAVAVADLNGDSFQDIIIGDLKNGGAQVYLNDGAASFPSSFALGEKMGLVFSIATADLDGDGDIDVVFGNRLAPGAILMNNNRENTFSATRFGDGDGTVYGLSIGDVNGDGVLDIVAARSDAPNMLYFGNSR